VIRSEKTGEVARVSTEGPLGGLNDIDIDCDENREARPYYKVSGSGHIIMPQKLRKGDILMSKDLMAS